MFRISRFIVGASIALVLLTTAIAEAKIGGAYAPDFAFSIDGHRYLLSAQRGRVVVLDFWASWCGPCQRSLPEINELNRSYDDVVFVGVNNEDIDTIRQVQRRLRLSFPTTLDADETISDLFGVRSIPTTVIIDRHGRLVDIVVGYRGDGAVERAIQIARRIP